MRGNPGNDVLDFVMLHLAITQRPHQADDQPVEERLAEAYDQARRDVTTLAETDVELCLALLADLAGHFAATLQQQAGHRAVKEVINDWAGRGWTPGIHRAEAITPTAVPTETQPDVQPATRPMPGGQRWAAGEPAPF
ncbi:hypothetical protein E9549_17490 [Blastococcus sp. MG754426]|uniref:hypothetical protein n=1 Tax=unclassified Blastococcus TaxID=2619396 RepID=UPI001EF13F72|nr:MULTISPECIES: hypothetical protein [unclassified Blastococcus]MCF6509181.1 hypothetical protein [Blastococcus sp. MG754426]MCF6513728.1 hypothetical protein [Blastococcus sp. MG754427]